MECNSTQSIDMSVNCAQNGLLLEKKEMEARLRDMEDAIAQSSTTGKADFVMRTEIEHLRQDL